MKSCSFVVTMVTAHVALITQPASLHAQELECPSAASLHVSEVEDEVTAFLPRGLTLDQPAQLQAAIQLLREHGMSSDDTINYLIALFCPAMSASTGSHAEKLERMRQFAGTVTRQVFAADTIRDIIYNVPLPPTAAAAAATRAGDVGLTVEQWIATTVEDALR
ncbi:MULTISPECIES: hypothetical protein [unclassified Mesorhizobium]|uniref:hypothetical protein n=1 Tax=unclassified Mesorhizobium TaxID=325217 RepID=UPI001CCEBF52|nr:MULTISPECIES: hypothetical protein [unclassified Mesorhizobium]MBZ9742192.1 hypothetical protein [Mesorhizobium sp. CO1-1-4]MBZ9805796.1 hypothetical protein [Mesorhizobium sp. ES1-6]MBZ9996202.1 hypothetical protein [Mesorhizobium sp. BH1-1-4]